MVPFLKDMNKSDLKENKQNILTEVSKPKAQ